MTPGEVELTLRAHESAMRRERENLDMLAWMAGSYAAHAYHQPKRYPKAPCIVNVKDEKKGMTAEDMKAVMKGLAKKGG